MHFHGPLADHQRCRDLVVGTAARDLRENLQFAWRELIERRLLLSVHLAQHACGHGWVKAALTLRGCPDFCDEVLRAGIFEEIGARASLDRAEDQIVVVIRG